MEMYRRPEWEDSRSSLANEWTLGEDDLEEGDEDPMILLHQSKRERRICAVEWRYVDEESGAIAEIGRFGSGRIIHLIDVPKTYRGEGVIGRLLRRICRDADKHGTPLYIEMLPWGRLSYEKREAWYRSLGFVPMGMGPAGERLYGRNAPDEIRLAPGHRPSAENGLSEGEQGD